MNWDRVLDRGNRFTIVMSFAILAFVAVWGLYELFNGASLLVGGSIICLLIAALVYIFWGSSKGDNDE